MRILLTAALAFWLLPAWSQQCVYGNLTLEDAFDRRIDVSKPYGPIRGRICYGEEVNISCRLESIGFRSKERGSEITMTSREFRATFSKRIKKEYGMDFIDMCLKSAGETR